MAYLERCGAVTYGLFLIFGSEAARGGSDMGNNLTRRLRRLETTFRLTGQLPVERARELESSIPLGSLERLATDDLRQLQTAVISLCEGINLTPEEQKALEAWRVAVEEECRDAGFQSFADLQQMCLRNSRSGRQPGQGGSSGT